MEKILIVDDHQIIADLLEKMLKNDMDFDVLKCSEFDEAIKLIKTKEFGFFIVDLGLKDRSGIDVIKVIRDVVAKPVILVLTAEIDEPVLREAIDCGIDGILHKTEELTLLKELLNQVLIEKQIIISPKVQELISDHSSTNNKLYLINELTKREKEVLSYIAEKKKSREISEILSISQETVKTHRKNIRSKLGMNNYSDLIYFAILNKKYLK
jgi:DNA-binding NarL/FixJ family response regulator